jgi:recombining binding protein (suppressor of hairless)
MTTVICLHAAVAQKSYSTEKRFLCPPPVVHVEGPVWHMRSQHLAMSVVSETGERSFDQKTALDTNMAASFKFLHVAGTGKAKSFQLTLDIAEPTPGSHLDDQGTGGRVWASFDSAPVTIISKPSKKTAKTRNISSCILAGGPVSLFNRINSQTVRTKYMTIENSQLCASNSTWSAFTVNVARRATDTTPLSMCSSRTAWTHTLMKCPAGPMAVTYGSEIILSDASSGISTAPLVVRKVEKGRIIVDDGGPVSQMQKIALQRINPDGTRHYLSAAYHGPQSNAANSQQNSTHPLLFTSSHLREETRDGVRTLFDELDDALCWTIVGICKQLRFMEF